METLTTLVTLSLPTKGTVAERIRQLLKRIPRENQSEFARLCGLNQADVHRYINALAIPGGAHLAAIAIANAVSVDWILGLDGGARDISALKPDGKLEIPKGAAALVDDEAIRRFLAEEHLGDRDTAYMAIDAHRRLVDAAEFARLKTQLDDAAKKSRRSRRRRPAE